MTDSVIVVGGGWAGLAAAVELAAAGQSVRLLEAAPQLGGRARGVPFGQDQVDNGQHLIIGAYRQTLELMRRIGVREDEAFERLPMRLSLYASPYELVELQLPAALPAPLNLFWALARAQGLTWRERRAALRLALLLGLRRFRVNHDLPLLEMLRHHRQPNSLISKLWSPICLATLNTPVEEASSTLFLNVLRDSFSRRASDADILMARHDLGRLLPLPAADFILSHSGEVLTKQRVTALQVENGRITGVNCGEQAYEATQVVLATPPWQTAELLRPLSAMADTTSQLDGLDSYPVTTVYLRYPQPVSLPRPMLGLLDGPGQWVSERRLSGQADMLSIVISGPGGHQEMDNPTLVRETTTQLTALFPALPEPVESLVIREKRATFRATVGIQAQRPQHDTAIEGLWLAGDYTAGPYPATLEGAVRSGLQCARRILRGK